MTTSQKKLKLDSLRSDTKKEREGDWQKASDIGDGVEFLVRSTNYPPYVLARDAASARMSKKYPNSSLPADDENYEQIPEAVIAEANGRNIAEHLLLDWRGLDIDYSPDLAMETLCDEEHRRLRMSVLIAATKVGRQEVEFIETTAKN